MLILINYLFWIHIIILAVWSFDGLVAWVGLIFFSCSFPRISLLEGKTKEKDLTHWSVNILTHNLDLIRNAQVDVLHFSPLTLSTDRVKA